MDDVSFDGRWVGRNDRVALGEEVGLMDGVWLGWMDGSILGNRVGVGDGFVDGS